LRSLDTRVSTFREYLEAIVVAVILALYVKAYVFEAFQIPSASMEDNLLVGDHVLVNKFVYGPHAGPWRRLLPYRDVARGDVFVFRSPLTPQQDLIKRAVAVGGDTVAVSAKRLLVNGVPAVEPFVLHRDPQVFTGPDIPEARRGRDELEPLAVPAGRIFAMGDNRDNSQDSRFFGPVTAASVRGRALLVYWSLAPSDREFAGRGAELRKVLDTAVHFFVRTRWQRSFRVVR
jgi:signal peptidase I